MVPEEGRGLVMFEARHINREIAVRCEPLTPAVVLQWSITLVALHSAREIAGHRLNRQVILCIE